MCKSCICNDNERFGFDNQAKVGPNQLGLVGYVHTKIMERVGQHADFPFIKPEEHYAIVVDETKRQFARAGFLGLELPSFEQELEMLGEIHATKPEDYIAKLERKGVVTTQGAAILIEVLAILDSNVPARIKVQLIGELAGFVAEARSLVKMEQDALLTGLFIAKASLEFWRRELRDKGSVFLRAVRERKENRQRLPWADIIGGVVNCLACGLTGGNVPGCIGCASTSSGLASTWFGKPKVSQE